MLTSCEITPWGLEINSGVRENNHTDCTRDYFFNAKLRSAPTLMNIFSQACRQVEINMAMRSRDVSLCEVMFNSRIKSGWMACQQAGFIMVMNPGGLSNYRCRRTERGGGGSGGITRRRHFVLITAQLHSNQFDKFPQALFRDISGNWQLRSSLCIHLTICSDRGHYKIFPADIFLPVARPEPSIPPTSPSVSVVISSQWSVGVHIPASSPQHQSATHSDRRHGLRGEQATQYSPRIKSSGSTYNPYCDFTHCLFIYF